MVGTSGKDKTRERSNKSTIVTGRRNQQTKTEVEMGKSGKERFKDKWIKYSRPSRSAQMEKALANRKTNTIEYIFCFE